MKFSEKELTPKIKRGDVVWLKSGGPEMTVQSVHQNTYCTCLWFLHGEIQRFEFETCSLTKKNPLQIVENKFVNF